MFIVCHDDDDDNRASLVDCRDLESWCKRRVVQISNSFTYLLKDKSEIQLCSGRCRSLNINLNYIHLCGHGLDPNPNHSLLLVDLQSSSLHYYLSRTQFTFFHFFFHFISFRFVYFTFFSANHFGLLSAFCNLTLLYTFILHFYYISCRHWDRKWR